MASVPAKGEANRVAFCSDVQYVQGDHVPLESEDDISYEYDGSHAAPTSGEKPPHRPRRSAASRRAQRMRSETRHFLRLAKGLVSIHQHRGSSLGPLGECMYRAVCNHQASASHVGTEQPSICRHWLLGRCTYGSRCRFSHERNNSDVEGTEHSREHSDEHYHDEHDTESHEAHDIVSGIFEHSELDVQHDEHHQGDTNQRHYGVHHKTDEACGNERHSEEHGLDEHHNKEGNTNEHHDYQGAEHDFSVHLHGDRHQEFHDEQSQPDDIDNINDFLGALQGEQEHIAYAPLPQHLLMEVHSRLVSTSAISTPKDTSTDADKFEISDVSETLQNKVLQMLQETNWNKRHLRKLCHGSILRIVLKSRVLNMPDYKFNSKYLPPIVPTPVQQAESSQRTTITAEAKTQPECNKEYFSKHFI